jgi:hypothetical protein
LAPAQWLELLDALCHSAKEAAGLPFAQMQVTKQLNGGELPLTLACMLPQLSDSDCDGFVDAGVTCITLGAREMLDGEGLPHARWIPNLRTLLACWTRCLRLARHTKGVAFDQDVTSQYEWMVRQALRLSRGDGSLIFTASSWDEPLFDAALQLDSDPADRLAARSLPWKQPPSFSGAAAPKGPRPPAAKAGKSKKASKPAKPAKPAKSGRVKPPKPSIMSEWSEFGLLRSSWEPHSPQLALAFDNRRVRAELNAAGHNWLAGTWSFQATADGKPLQPADDYSEVCWHSDKEVDYLELQLPLTQDWQLQRHYLLDRRDGFLFLADALVGPQEADVQFAVDYPLAADVNVEVDSETRELTLRSGKRTATALPLALPEWHAERSPGEFRLSGGRLQQTWQRRGARAFLPLFIHLNPGRSKRFTWRRLTVAEDLRILPETVAVGYRVQFGDFHYLFYRSLAAAAPRTVLGQHIGSEFLAGRFLPDGELDELIEIET